MNDPHAAFVGRLLHEIPELREIYDEHLEEQGELLAHLFIADVVRWLVDQYPQGNEAGDPAWQRLLKFAESQYQASGPEIENLLTVSFVENLPAPGTAKADIARHLGKGLGQVYREIFTANS